MSDTPPIKLYAALYKAQQAFGAVVKNKQNPHLKNFYADLGAVLETVEQTLWDNALIIVQRFTHEQGAPALITELIHAESGQSITSTLPVICKDPSDPQKLGGAITYARRYSLLALLSLTAEDDDGNSAAQPAPQRQQQYPPSQPTSAPRSNGSAPTRAAQPPTPQRPPQPPTPALAPDDPLADVLATLRGMETRREPWAAIKKYGDEQGAMADDYGKATITSTLHAIATRRKAAAPSAPQHEVS